MPEDLKRVFYIYYIRYGGNLPGDIRVRCFRGVSVVEKFDEIVKEELRVHGSTAGFRVELSGEPGF